MRHNSPTLCLTCDAAPMPDYGVCDSCAYECGPVDASMARPNPRHVEPLEVKAGSENVNPADYPGQTLYSLDAGTDPLLDRGWDAQPSRLRCAFADHGEHALVMEQLEAEAFRNVFGARI